MKRKIAVVGAGNAACITALHYYFHGKDLFDITLYHDPTLPQERVGQGFTVGVSSLIGNSLGIDWYDNPIAATFKSGIMYEGSGSKRDKIFHSFPLHHMAMHYSPTKLSRVVLDSGKFKVIEKKIDDPEREIDSDYIFDCRGRNNRNKDDYEPILNPLTSVLLYEKMEADPNLHYTRHVATPNGWTFVIPHQNSVSYGYLYNNTLTSKEDAIEDFLERFELPEIDGQLDFDNYIAKNIFVGERTILNGNRSGFIEPMESSAADMYLDICRYSWNWIVGREKRDITNMRIRKLVKEVETFILWHYKKGSKYNTPFWKYARSLPFKPDYRFTNLLKRRTDSEERYGNWTWRAFDIWRRNT